MPTTRDNKKFTKSLLFVMIGDFVTLTQFSFNRYNSKLLLVRNTDCQTVCRPGKPYRDRKIISFSDTTGAELLISSVRYFC